MGRQYLTCRALFLSFAMIWANATLAEPKDIAFLVGVWDYSNYPNFGDLSKTSTKDTINSLERILNAHGFAVQTRFNPTTETFRSELDRFLRQEAQRAVFYFTGHGIDTNEVSYLLLGDSANVEGGRTPFRLDELAGSMGETSARKLLVVLDACYAGRIMDFIGNRQESSSPPPTDLDNILQRVADVTVITASGKGRPVQAGGAFGTALACSLSPANPGGPTITSDEVVNYVARCMCQNDLAIPKRFESGHHGITFSRKTTELPQGCDSCGPLSCP